MCTRFILKAFIHLLKPNIMKVKLLLCMMLLGALAATAQLPQELRPQVLEGGFHWRPNLKSLSAKPFLRAEPQLNSLASNPVVSSAHKAKPKPWDGKPTHQVNFVLDFDTQSQSIRDITFLHPEYGKFNNWSLDVYDLEYGSNTLDVPEGTYDIVVNFQKMDPNDNEWIRNDLYVIREQVTIDQDMELNFAASEAKNHIHFQTMTIDGEPAYTGLYGVDENWNVKILEEGNTDDVICHRKFYCEGYGTLNEKFNNFAQTVVFPDYIDASGEDDADFYVNNVSDRWVFYSYRTAIKGVNVYTSAYETRGASGDITVSNDPSKFQLFEDPFMTTDYQGLYVEERIPAYYFGADGWQFGCNCFETLPDGENYKIYLSASPDDSEVGFVPYIYPIILNGNYEVLMYGPTLTVSNNHAIIANNGFYPFGTEYSEELDEYGRDIKTYPSWPTHPVFSYPVEKKKENLGNNCPFLVAYPNQYEDIRGTNTTRVLYLDLLYRGRYGETKSQFNMADVKMKLDGNDLLSADGPFYTTVDELLNGVVDATIVKEGLLIDDMAASNKAQLHYTAGAEDQNPPLVTMLQFKDDDENVTDRFATAADGTLELSAGDFNYFVTPVSHLGTWFRYIPEAVEVSYSPYGEDNWDELAVEEVPENYWPTMGWFYTGSLASVTGQGLNGWFDLKIRVTDTAGNWQEQIISPAFRIDDLAYSSVASVGSSNAHEVARYNLAGQRVDANATGVVIIKMSDGTARKVLVK